MGGKCDYNNSVEKFEQDSQSGPAPDRRINTMANCAIVGINWGDEGKGRMVDYLTDHYDVVVRYQGGGNAGHTVVNEKGKFALHLLPSGIFRDGVVNILGNGVALDCENLLKEMETLRAAGVIITPENLKVSDRASLLLPWHRELDALEEARLVRLDQAGHRAVLWRQVPEKDRAGGRAPAPRALKRAPFRPS